MAWNRPSEGAAKPKKPNAMRGVVAGLVVVCALGGLCLWMFSGGDDAPKAKPDKERGRIKEVTPATNKVVQVKKKPRFRNAPEGWDKPYPPKAYWPDGRLKEHTKYVKVVTNNQESFSASIESRTFKNYADRQIAFVINMRPGELVLPIKVGYGEAFLRSFKANLDTPIEFDENDTPAQVELKKAVIETKKELRARYEAGEDICKLMNDTRDEMRELCLYRQEIEKMVQQTMSENQGKFSAKDKDDLVRAANQMLRDRGVERELTLPSALVSKMQMYKESRNRNNGGQTR